MERKYFSGQIDGWMGIPLAEIAPNLFKAVPKWTAKRTIAQTLHNTNWAQDIKGARTVEVILEYLHIWDYYGWCYFATGDSRQT